MHPTFPFSRSSRRFVVLLLACLGIISMLVAVRSQALGDSEFEIDENANLTVDTAGNTDWSALPPTLLHKTIDLLNGEGDDAFGGGTSENDTTPKVVEDSIPPNKSDITRFYESHEVIGTDTYIYLAWERVQAPSGTTNFDFELNQSETINPDNGVTPVRTAGDVLISYDLASGGTHPELSQRIWRDPADCGKNAKKGCWSSATPLSASEASASVNKGPGTIQDPIGPNAPRSLDPFTFGEAAVNLTAAGLIPSGGCNGFAYAYLKSRSSDSFNSEIKDFTNPISADISNCGSVEITKTDDAGTPLAGATFTLYKDNGTIGGTRGVEDTSTSFSCTTNGSGICLMTDVPKGEYWAVETATPAGYETAGDQHVTVTADNTSQLTFVDPRTRGAILVTKLRKHAAAGSGDHPHSGVNFTVNGVTKATDADGKACFDGLLLGSYTVHETVPAGYHGEADKSVTVDNAAFCTNPGYAGESVTFHNTPLSDITVSFTSEITGGTAAKISCTGLATNPPDGTPNVFDDTSETFTGLEPGTYSCTVVVDP
jgi:uncharacterized surface anchored protein